MGIDPMQLTDKQKSLMSPAARKSMGKAGMTGEEAQLAYVARNESEIQQQVIDLLHRVGVEVVRRSRMDKPTTDNVGYPDLTFVLKTSAIALHAIAWEVKMPGKKPRENQTKMMDAMTKDGWHCAVIHNYAEALSELRKLGVDI